MQKKTRCSEDRNYLAWLPICANCALFGMCEKGCLLQSCSRYLGRKSKTNWLNHWQISASRHSFISKQGLPANLWDESLNGRFANVAAFSSGHWWWSRYLWCEPTHGWGLRAPGGRANGSELSVTTDNRWVNWRGSDMCASQSSIDQRASE